MIARLIRSMKRALLAAEIADMESDLTSIAEQRANDEHAEEVISRELAIARRQLQAMCQAELTIRKFN